MSLHSQPHKAIPELTAEVAHAAFPKGNPYLKLRDELGPIDEDDLFVDLYPSRGQPAAAPWRLALITVLQFAENPKVTDQEVFVIGSNAGPAPIAGAQCSPYTFITSWQNDNQAEVVGEYANQKGYKKVVGMAPNYQAGKDFIAGFKRNYKGEVIDEIYTPLNQLDFSAELAQVAAKNPDAVYVF